jgi:hypothetical protein
MIHPPVRDILSGFEGVVNPGEMLRMRFPYQNRHLTLDLRTND